MLLLFQQKNALEDKIKGLQLGADDYLTKPFHLSELLVRIQALVRRKQFNGNNLISFNEIEIDTISKSVKIRGNKIEFTKTKINAEKVVPKYKVSLGIMPDYTDHGDGLHVDGVTENRPAQQAGIQAGDVITKIGDCTIKEVYGYMDCLSKLSVGDEKDVTIMRNGKPITVKVKF